MIRTMPPPFNLNISIDELYQYRLARLGPTLSHKLAQSLATHFNRPNSHQATVEDLLNYLPMRYEDRSNPSRIADLSEGMEASLELIVKIAGGFQVKNRRTHGRSSLFIFEVTATDPDRTGRPVVVWWFVSGAHAHDIIAYYTKRFARGARFTTFGTWEWDKRRATFSLKLSKPADELEMLPSSEHRESASAEVETNRDSLEEEERGDPALAMIHVGRYVPIYRKLGEFSSKHIREVIHATLAHLPDTAIVETLPEELLRRRKLIGRAEALRQIHFPPEKHFARTLRTGAQPRASASYL